jgi:hypothetical protein
VGFWEEKSLEEMSGSEWESLCDGCARCCLLKIEEADSEEVHYTSVVCKYMDESTCQCNEYDNRNSLVPDCVWLTIDTVESYKWLPKTCAYRIKAEGRSLHSWHPLLSGRSDTVHEIGISVVGKCISEEHVHSNDVEDNIIHWVEH